MTSLSCSEQTARRAAWGTTVPWAAPFTLDAEHDLGFDEAIERVEAALRFGIDPSLEPVEALLSELGHPERAFACVQVAGTNGKTSTSRYTAALLAGEGLRCGLYTSPHLVDYTERVEVDGRCVRREAFARGVSWALAAWERIAGRNPALAEQGCTEFELLTAAAMTMYAQAGVDVAVLEVGLGGRWDATSAVPTVAAAVTGIGLDHTRILGDTLEAIAAEKAAVIRRGNPCVLGTNAVRPDSVLGVMARRCADVGVVPTAVVEESQGDRTISGSPQIDAVLDHGWPLASFAVVHRPQHLGDALVVDVCVDASLPAGERVHASYEGVCAVAPAYQAQNIACALALATCVLGGPLDPGRACESIARTRVPGRFEVVRTEPLALLDACHNPQSAEAFAQAVIDAEPVRERRPVLLLGALSDKDHRGIVETVAPLFDRIVVAQSSSARAYGAHELAVEVERTCGRRPEAVFEAATDALEYLCGESFVGCGTITLIGELAALLR